MRYLIYISAFVIFSFNLLANVAGDVKIGIEHDKFLGKTIDLDAQFTNADGETQTLRQIIDKPTVLALVYYDCPGICSPLLTNLGETIDKAKITPGEEYQVLSISFDPTEKPRLAKKWRDTYQGSLERQIDVEDWQFYTGDSANIKKLTNSVGFYYKKEDTGEYTHSGALIMISPDGKITRYLLGTTYNPFDFKMAIVEASKGVATPPINKVLEYCFSYDPEGQSYVFNVNKIAGTVIFLGVGIFLAVLLIKGRKRKIRKGDANG